MATTIRLELEDESPSAIRKGQETALEALKPLVEAVQYVIPAMPAVRAPFAAACRRRRMKLWPAGTSSPSTCWLTSGSLPTS